MQEYLETVLNQCLDILESDNGSIMITDKNTKEFVVRVARGQHSTPILGQRLGLGEGISGLVAKRRKPLLIEDISKDGEIKERSRGQNYRTNSFVSVPMISSVKLIGVINITEKTSGRPFTIKELSFVSAIASAAAKTIESTTYSESLRSQLDSFKRSTAITKFTSSIAHELNNPLDGIMRYTQLCLSQVEDENVLKEYLFEMQGGLKRMAGIIRSMLEFSFAGDRNVSPEPREDVHINSVLKKSLAFFAQQAHFKHITIDTELEENLPLVKDCGLEQVFVNVIKNSIEAIENNGTLTVKDYRSNGHLCIDFTDSGKGIDEQCKSKIFEPFFTTKPSGKGLGLAIVKKIVDCYDGEVTLENSPAGGAKFTVLIPIGGKP